MVKRSAGQALVEALQAHGVHRAFCVPGESYLAVLDALYDAQIDLITCRHEAGAANMAEASAKLTGHPGICFVTRGPGATHASIAVHTAFQDSTPMILFIGDVATDQRDREAFQEVDFTRMFGPLAKWAARIERADRMPEYVARAFAVACQGRPGPVVLALPEDMLRAECPSPVLPPMPPAKAAPEMAAMAQLQERLAAAQRPLAILGGPGWTKPSVDQLADWLERTQIPAAASFRAQDLLNNDHPCYAGDLGIVANPKLTGRLDEADLLLAIGPRLGEMTSGGYTRFSTQQPLIHVHPGAEELGRVHQAATPIQSDIGLFVDALTAMEVPGERATWRAALRADYKDYNAPVDTAGALKPARLWSYLSETLPREAIVTNGAGNYAAWLHRFYRYRHFKSQLAPTSGAMGYGVPAAIAAKLAYPDRPVICAAGDGCFMMSVQELATAAQYELAIVFLVFDNGLYGTIRAHQHMHYPGRPVGTKLENPDFVSLAESFGMRGFRVSDNAGFETVLPEALASSRSCLIHVRMNPSVLSPGLTI